MLGKKRYSVYHLANWYFGNFCAMKYGHGRECYDSLQRLAKELEIRGVKEMTHKEFCIVARENLTCKPVRRIFEDCSTCRKLGIQLNPR